MSLKGSQDFDRMAYAAWEKYRDGDLNAIDNIYEYLMPFCLRVSSKTCRKFVRNEDEEASIARMAMLEAFERYDPAKGPFLVFLGRVVKNRVIDFLRREKRHRSFTLLVSGDEGWGAWVDDYNILEEITEEIARKQEIEKLQSLLADFDITFSDLAKSSPKQGKTRHQASNIALYIAADDELSRHLMDKKLLPIKELESRYHVNRKLVDRYRKYIIANVLIIRKNLTLLQPYIQAEGGQKDVQA